MPQERFTIFNAWEKTGITEHLGGVDASKELFKFAEISSDQMILEIGCGTGYTATVLARRGNRITSIDLDPKLLDMAKKRAEKTGVTRKIIFKEADAENLPFENNTFDRAIAESVIIFTDPRKTLAEAYRILKPGGILGINEYTRITPVSEKTLKAVADLYALSGTTIQNLSEDEWKEKFRQVGFTDVRSIVHHLNAWQQLKSHLQVDGPIKLLNSLHYSLTVPEYKKIWGVTTDLLKNMGYGLYRGTKPI